MARYIGFGAYSNIRRRNVQWLRWMVLVALVVVLLWAGWLWYASTQVRIQQQQALATLSQLHTANQQAYTERFAGLFARDQFNHRLVQVLVALADANAVRPAGGNWYLTSVEVNNTSAHWHGYTLHPDALDQLVVWLNSFDTVTATVDMVQEDAFSLRIQ